MKIKIKKLTKSDIIEGIQFFIMLYTMLMGFWWTYMLVWVKCGLPREWWGLPVTLMLAFLSLFGFCTWATRRAKNG